jgi:uncharacterized repeat protein (TIGR01451 family)
MFRPPLFSRASIDACRSAVVTRLALAGVALLCCTGNAFAGAAVVTIDGDLQDMIDYAGSISVPDQGCAFTDPDPAMDIRIFDPKIVPCVPVVDNYYVNGFDQILDVLAYDRTAQTLYLGMRVAGVIGDPDGNGNPSTKCPEGTFDDEPGIGFDDSYTWELNFDCAGAAEVTIEVRNNQLTVTGATTGTQDFAFNGSDLEVAIENIELPPAYAVRVFAGNIADGLGEDLHELLCSPPGPEILVDKSANPERICPGQNTTFTIVVTNPGVVELQQVTLVDDLPAGLSYVAASASNDCGVGAPNVNGQQLTWPNFSLAAGASCTFTFQAQAGAQCLGPQLNVATATGSFATACFNEGKPQVVQDSDDATVTCAPPPCVEITQLTGPPSACVNADVTINGSVRNCSPEPETIVVSLVGFGSVDLGTVGPGQSVDFGLTGNLGDCAPGGKVEFTARAVATNECGTDEDEAGVQVLCLGPPCVNITALNVPTEACPNAAIVITGLVENCGTEPATIVVSLNGGAPVNLGVVPGGQDVGFKFNTTMGECTAGESVSFSVLATATNECGEDTDTEARDVLCADGPCVKLSLECSPERACPGTQVTISGTVANCSDDPEDIVVTMGTFTFTFTDVPAGGTNSFTATTELPECTDGELVEFTATAVATNDCGEVEETASCSIECEAPQIDIEKSAEAEVAIGGTIHYTITLTNPSKTVTLENIEICDELCSAATYADNASPTPDSEPAIGQAGGTICWSVASLAPGASLTFTFEAIAVGGGAECTEDVTCTNTVRASGECGDAEATDTDSFATVIPCEQGLCRLTGGGCLNENGDQRSHKQHTFGGNVSPCPTGPPGPTGDSWEHVVRNGRTILFNFHSWEPCITACSVVEPGPCSPHGTITRADFEGPGRYSLGPGSRERDATFTAYIIDHREGGCNRDDRDEYAITVRDAETNLIVFQFAEQEIDCGNLQIHETPRGIFDTAPALQLPVAGELGVALLGRPYPNPFAASMSFGYEVPSGEAQAVEVGIYNVAGRLITRLASEVQSPGRYTVRWDGRDASGVAMAPGVYFLKSRVGPAETVSRLLKVAD